MLRPGASARYGQIGQVLLRLLAAAALAVDAYVHADLAGRYDLNRLHGLSQGQLFLIETAVSGLAALVLMLTGRRLAWLLAFLVAGSALGAVLLYRYYDPGALGPLPDMYEPIWYPEKTLTAVAEGVATVLSAAGLLLARGRWRPDGRGGGELSERSPHRGPNGAPRAGTGRTHHQPMLRRTGLRHDRADR